MSAQLMEEVVRLKTLLEQEQACHREFRKEVFSDPEFKAIIERRGREAAQKRTEDYVDRLLDEVGVA
jgi:hypothetical protein